MPTLISRGRCFAGSAFASGSVICSSAIRWYVVVTIRKIRMTSSTSINGMKLISGSSRVRLPRKFIAAPLRRGGKRNERTAGEATRSERRDSTKQVQRAAREETTTPAGRAVALRSFALVMREVDQFDGLLLHLDDEGIDLRAEMAVEDHARNRDDQAHRRVVERDRDALRELDRVRS